MFALRKDRAAEGDRQLTASQKHGVIYQDDYVALEGQKVVQVIIGADILKHVEPNDFVISMRSFQGGIEWCGYSGSISSAYVMLIPSDSIDANFFTYLFKCKPYIQALQSTSNLVRDGQALRFENFALIDLPVIPLSEQASIAAFLDHETAKIDELIAEQQRLIGLLNEKRRAVISHSVTKGLNPAAPMKDSEVEWLGDVPVHWNIKPLRALSDLIQTGPFGSQLHSEDYVEGETPVINPSNIRDGQIIPDLACTVGSAIAERLNQHRLKEGDIVFARRGEMGRCARVSAKEAGWLCGTGSITVRLDGSTISEFVSIYLGTRYVRELLRLESVGATMDNLNTSILSRIPVPVPPLDEQATIAAFLELQTHKFETLTTEACTAVALLQERRAALVSAAVTGKIDVRGLPMPPREKAAAA
jgi:type I restriction enzyme S subunit